MTADRALAPAPPQRPAPLLLPTTELVLQRGQGERRQADQLALTWSRTGIDRRGLWTGALGFFIGLNSALGLAWWARRRSKGSGGADHDTLQSDQPPNEPTTDAVTLAPVSPSPTAPGTQGHEVAANTGSTSRRSDAEPSDREPVRLAHDALGLSSSAKPATGEPPPHQTGPADSAQEPLARLARAYWRDKGLGLSGLREKAHSTGLELFEWRRFDDVLRVPAASAVPLEFVPWERGSRGPVFLGHSTDGSLFLVPTSSTALGSDQGLSALRKLFELRPGPNSKTFEFRDLVRPCRVRSEGSCYRLVEKGVVRTDAEDRGAEVDITSTSHIANRLPPPLGRPASDSPASSVEPAKRIEKLIQRELAEQAQHLLEEIRDSGAPRGGVSLDSDSLEQIRTIVLEVVASSMQQSQGAAHASSDDSGSTRASLRETRRSNRQHESAVSPEPPASPAQPLIPRPESGGPNPLRTTWMEAVLQRSRFAPPFGRKRYVEDLHQLGSTLRQAAPATRWTVRLFQVRLMDGGQLGLDPVELLKDAKGDFQLFGADGGSLPDYLWWEVMLGLSSEAPDSTGRLALLFPWSRHETGAPHLARELVAGEPTRGLPDVVRCTAPAELVATGGERVYSVVRKLAIAPVEGT